MHKCSTASTYQAQKASILGILLAFLENQSSHTLTRCCVPRPLFVLSLHWWCKFHLNCPCYFQISSETAGATWAEMETRYRTLSSTAYPQTLYHHYKMQCLRKSYCRCCETLGLICIIYCGSAQWMAVKTHHSRPFRDSDYFPQVGRSENVDYFTMPKKWVE